MNCYLTVILVFGVFMFFKKANGQSLCEVNNNTITSCDGSYKSGNYINMNFIKISRPCSCTINALFSGRLLVTAVQGGSYQCRTEVTVISGKNTSVFNCAAKSKYPSAVGFDVNANETVVNVKADYTAGYTSGNFSFCLKIHENGGLGGKVSVACGNSTTNTKFTTPTTTTAAGTTTTTATAATIYPSKPETSSSTTSYNISNAVDSSPQKSTYPSSDNMTYIIAGAAAGALVLVVVVIVLVAIIVLRKKKGGKNDQNQKTDEASQHTNRAFDENYGLPDNPLYHSAQPLDEVGYSSVQNNQLGLPPTDATNTKKNDPNYDVPTNNKPINDSDTSPMPIYAVPNKSGASPPEENEPQAMYAQVSKPSKSTTQVPMQSANQDGLVHLEVEKDATSVNENSPYTKNENKESVSYAEIKRN